MSVDELLLNGPHLVATPIVLAAGIGLWFLGALKVAPWASHTVRFAHRSRSGSTGAPILGAMSAIGRTPCIGPALAAVLTLSATSGGAARGGLLAFVYAAGLGVPFILPGPRCNGRQASLPSSRTHPGAVMRTGGLLLNIVGVPEVSGVRTLWMTAPKALLRGTVLPS